MKPRKMVVAMLTMSAVWGRVKATTLAIFGPGQGSRNRTARENSRHNKPEQDRKDRTPHDSKDRTAGTDNQVRTPAARQP
jgi:hypothetical protein